MPSPTAPRPHHESAPNPTNAAATNAAATNAAATNNATTSKASASNAAPNPTNAAATNASPTNAAATNAAATNAAATNAAAPANAAASNAAASNAAATNASSTNAGATNNAAPNASPTNAAAPNAAATNASRTGDAPAPGSRVPLSVLDLAPVAKGSTPADALHNARDLAQLAERLGYHRYWVAEHHNMPGIASSSPPVLLAHVGAATSTIRLGSGGVMLPNHTPLVIAEQFGMLEALHPGRIDLGIGRAPGTDPMTARALRRSNDGSEVDAFPQHVVQLQGFFEGTFADDHPYRSITAVPALGYPPDLWLLGSSDYSAHLAGLLGLPFSFAHHFSAANTLPALARYRASFRPSAGASDAETHSGRRSTRLERPHAMVAVSVLCAETEEEARWLAGPSALSFVLLRSGRPGPVPTPQEAAEYPYTPADRAVVGSRLASSIIGDPTQVREQLESLVERTDADELMVVTMAHAHADRRRSFELLAEVWEAASPGAGAGNRTGAGAGDPAPASVG